MGVAQPGVTRDGASFELDRLELVDERMVVRGWWFGVRGVRFVRPALVVDGRQILATLEHKPWAASEDGAWIAAFPWKKRRLDVGGVALVVAPSVEVPLDRDAEAPPVLREVAVAVPSAPGTVVEEVREPLRDELAGIERELDATHAELRDARAHAAEREARCRELEEVVARERRVADEAGAADDELVRAHAMAVLDRDRSVAQLEEAVGDREAAMRARKRMERQRDAALAAREEAEARRDEALAERDEARRQRDELVLVNQSLQAQLKGTLAEADRTEPLPLERVSADAEPTALGASTGTRPDELRSPRQLPRPRRSKPPASRPEEGPPEADADAPIGVRTIPAARAVAGSLHRSERERKAGVTQYDMWAIRILGSVAALAFISLLVMILKAFFVF
jgi:hypothetical protein